MPGFYPVDEYDLAGFAVGVVDKKDMITGEDLQEGDVLVGLASSGVHSNGFSLVRKVFDMTPESLDTYYEELDGKLGDVLLAPTKIYVKAMKAIKDAGVKVRACSHITGGGFYENVPRMLKDGVVAQIEKDSYPVPPIFRLMQKKGNIDEHMMYNTYNMGIGMVLAVRPEDVETTMKAAREAGEYPYRIGKIVSGTKGVELV
jgi:phosphoribosylformylglycinamidine cyclo-ligase